MANERRLRPNYVAGTIDTALDSSGVTISGQALTRLPVIDATNYAVLTLVDPVAGTFEIVYVLAHTAGAPVATMLRGVEGSTARAWPANTTFVVAPSAADFRPSLDDTWAGDLGFDEDFARGNVTALPSPWVWASQNGATYAEDRGWGNIITPSWAASTFYHFMIARALPTPATWTATVKLIGTFQKSAIAGSPGGNPTFGIRSGTGAQFIAFEWRSQTNTLMVNYFTNQTTYSGVSPLNISWAAHGGPTYLQIIKTAANTYSFAISGNGSAFTTVLAGYTPPFTSDQLVLGAVVEGGPVGPGVASFDWLRVR